MTKPVIICAKNGPLRICGAIELQDAHWGQGASPEHYTLCRCGASMNKPFCDGSHLAIHFDDGESPDQNTQFTSSANYVQLAEPG